MPKFSRRSKENLATCDQQLQYLFSVVIETWDCSILCGYRNEEDQALAYAKGHSSLLYPDSKHNKTPSLAVDVAPWPIVWDDHVRFGYFAGYVKRVAWEMSIPIRWGGDWDSDTNTIDHTLRDYPHFELR